MTVQKLKLLFSQHSDKEFLRFNLVFKKRSQRSDLHAMIKLGSLLPGKVPMVSSAEHDIIFLEPSLEDLAKVTTEEDVIELLRCGVMIEEDSLAIFT